MDTQRKIVNRANRLKMAVVRHSFGVKINGALLCGGQGDFWLDYTLPGNGRRDFSGIVERLAIARHVNDTADALGIRAICPDTK